MMTSHHALSAYLAWLSYILAVARRVIRLDARQR